MTDSNIVQFPRTDRAALNGRRLIPSRLRDARRAMRFTQEDLGSRARVSRQAISAFESGSKSPDPDTFALITEALQQPPSYFTTEDGPTFGDFGTRFFRKAGPDTIRRNDACTVLGGWLAQSARYLDAYINYPAVDVPRAHAKATSGRYEQDEIEEIAATCRTQWGLGLGPISNVLALIESKGVVICKYEMPGENVDAFSFWNGEKPFIFMASEKEAGVRIRFDAAHELGHLILHRWIEAEEIADPKILKAIESEADRFAGAFLLPRRSFPNEVYTARLDAFLELKRRWLTSIQAMIYRCRDLGVIDDDQFTNLYKQISFRKWRKKEPLDDPKSIRLERPNMLSRAALMIIESGLRHPDEICAELALDPTILSVFWNIPLEMFKPGEKLGHDPSLR